MKSSSSMDAKVCAALCSVLIVFAVIWCFLDPFLASADTSVADQGIDTVSVSGHAEVKTTPDKCSVTFGVELKKSTADAANSELSSRSDAIIKALKAAGVSEKDIQTTRYSVDVSYYWDDNKRVVDGYRGSCTLSITGVDIDKIGSVIDSAVNAGADSVGSVNYYSSNYDASYRDALSQAIKEARAKADAMGETAGFRVVRVHNLKEGYQNDSMKYIPSNSMVAEDSVSMTGGASVAAGELSVEAYVQIEYVIQ